MLFADSSPTHLKHPFSLNSVELKKYTYVDLVEFLDEGKGRLEVTLERHHLSLVLEANVGDACSESHVLERLFICHLDSCNRRVELLKRDGLDTCGIVTRVPVRAIPLWLDLNLSEAALHRSEHQRTGPHWHHHGGGPPGERPGSHHALREKLEHCSRC